MNKELLEWERMAYERRRRTRNERRQKRRTIILVLCFAAWLLVVAVISFACVLSGVPECNYDPPTENAVSTPQSAIVSDFVDENLEAFENELIEAALLAKSTKIEDVTVTHYCTELYPHICGTGDGITASGMRVAPYTTVAVDPDVIPLGSDVLVDYGDGVIHYYRADDVGAWVKGNHIDVAVKYHDEAEQLGVKTATVYWCKEDDA